MVRDCSTGSNTCKCAMDGFLNSICKCHSMQSDKKVRLFYICPLMFFIRKDHCPSDEKVVKNKRPSITHLHVIPYCRHYRQ